MAGAFDCFEDYHRRQYLFSPDGDMNLIEKSIKYGHKVHEEKNAAQQSLFGGENGLEVPVPKVPQCEPYGGLEKLKIEKEVVGFYISGHPLDQFKFEMRYLVKNKLGDLQQLESKIGLELTFAGIVSDVAHKITKNGKPFGIMTIEGYDDSHTFYLFSDDYLKFKEYMVNGWFLFIRGGVVQKPWGDQQLEFKIKSIDLLSEIREKMSKTLRVKIKPAQLQEMLIDRIESIVTGHPGKCNLRVDLVDEEENIAVELLSRKYLVKPADDLLKQLDKVNEIEYTILT